MVRRDLPRHPILKYLVLCCVLFYKIVSYILSVSEKITYLFNHRNCVYCVYSTLLEYILELEYSILEI